jgi:hypothetical protein
MCCVGESMALDTCINNYNCMDDTCITTNCMAQVNALNTCFGHRQATDPACTMLVRGCLGSDYPMVQCLMP